MVELPESAFSIAFSHTMCLILTNNWTMISMNCLIFTGEKDTYKQSNKPPSALAVHLS